MVKSRSQKSAVVAHFDQLAKSYAHRYEGESALAHAFRIDMQRLRIVGQRGEQEVVGLGDRAAYRMVDGVAHLPLFVIASWHSCSLGRQQKLRNGLGDRLAVEPVGGVEVRQAAGLAETVDAERRDPLAEYAA